MFDSNHSSDEVLVWVVPLAPNVDACGRCESYLAKDEIVRANRFVTQELRRRFVVSRGRLRQLLADYVGCAPAEVRFRYEQWGKPQLAMDGATHLHFNVTHSGDWALIAMADCAVGVDLEVPNARINYRAIASQVLTDREKVVWDTLPAPSRELAIMRLWVCKEAILKAMGLGIAEGLRKISFPLPIPERDVFNASHIDPSLQLHLDDDGTCQMNSWIDSETWRVRLIDAIPGCTSALTTLRRIRQITLQTVSDE